MKNMELCKKIGLVTVIAFITCSFVFSGNAFAGKKKKAKKAYERGVESLEKGDYRSAWFAFNDVIKKYTPKDVNAWILRGRADFLTVYYSDTLSKSVKNVYYNQSIKDFNKAIELEPNNALAHVLLGRSYHWQKKYDQAEKEIKKGLELKIRPAELPLWVGEMDAHFFLGQIYYYQGKNDAALAQFKKVLETYGGGSTRSDTVIQWYNEKHISNDLLVQGDKENLHLYDKMNKSHVYDYRITYWHLGNVYKKKGERVKARDYYQKAVDREIGLGERYLLKMTLEDFQEYAKKNPGKAPPEMTQELRKYLVQGQALRKARKYDEAIEKLKKAVEIEPREPTAHYNLGMIEAARERYHYAINYMKCFLALVPNHKKAQKAQDKIYEWEALAK